MTDTSAPQLHPLLSQTKIGCRAAFNIFCPCKSSSTVPRQRSVPAHLIETSLSIIKNCPFAPHSEFASSRLVRKRVSQPRIPQTESTPSVPRSVPDPARKTPAPPQSRSQSQCPKTRLVHQLRIRSQKQPATAMAGSSRVRGAASLLPEHRWAQRSESLGKVAACDSRQVSTLAKSADGSSPPIRRNPSASTTSNYQSLPSSRAQYRRRSVEPSFTTNISEISACQRTDARFFFGCDRRVLIPAGHNRRN